jgi:hypothetical protein
MSGDQYAEFEPTRNDMNTLLKRRQQRADQRKSRGDKSSGRDGLEDSAILLAWEVGELTEGQAARALRVDRVALREMKLRLVAVGRALAHHLLSKSQTPTP